MASVVRDALIIGPSIRDGHVGYRQRRRATLTSRMRPPVHVHLRGKTVLLTGGTGFLGKVIVERLLRCAPEIGRIYLLIRPRSEDQLPAATRFETEVLTSGAFCALARSHGHQWPAFARGKLVPIDGDVSRPRLGLADGAYAALTSCVDIIINAAASVTFDAPID